jgi:hypothetical protein
MEQIMNILVDNYIYVALGSAFLIIVLIGIVVSSNRKRKKAKNPDMVSMSDVTTGSINDVANNLNAQKNPEMPAGMQPLNVAEVRPSTNNQPVAPVAEEAIPQELYAPMGNAAVAPNEEVKPVPTVDVNPYGNVEKPAISEPSFQPVFGSETVAEPVAPQSTQEIPATPVVEPVQEVQINPAPVVPTPSVQPEVLDIEGDAQPVQPVATETNPLNGEAPTFEQNSNQNI